MKAAADMPLGIAAWSGRGQFSDDVSLLAAEILPTP